MATLVITNGPMSGRKYKVLEAKTILGRHPECGIVLDSETVSRLHAQILTIQNHYFVEDLNSRNGTFLNGQRIEKRMPLTDRDNIQISDTSLQFHDTPRLFEKQKQDTKVVISSYPDNNQTIILHSFDPISDIPDSETRAGAEIKLRALLEVMNNLGGSLELEQILSNLIDSLFKIFTQADRGFIVLKNNQGSLEAKWAKVRHHIKSDTLHISRSIIEHVLHSKEVILSEDAGSDRRFDSSKSIVAYQIHSVMCAPILASDGEAFGVLQLDTLHRTHRFKTEDLEILAGIAYQAAIAINNVRLHEYSVKQHLLQQDLELAHQVQRSFLPRQKPDLNDYDFFNFYQPANQIGGDFFDYITLPDCSVAVVVADVAGHGVAAALMMAKLSAHVRFYLDSEKDPKKIIMKLNSIFCINNLNDRFITFVMALINPDSHQVSMVNAGHMAPMIRRNNGKVERIGEETTGVPLGVINNFQYDVSTTHIHPGELIAMYTDGINESRNQAGDFYGEAPIEKIMRSSNGNAAEFGHNLIENLRQYCNQQPHDDDICLVSFSRKP